jgi:SAM-dependent methyltransferase/protein tyrosine phosphatase (PTP) superfamily phosphohydrolase (DUF442 family)
MQRRARTINLFLIPVVLCIPHTLPAQQPQVAEPPGRVEATAADKTSEGPAEVEKASLGNTKNVHRVGELYLAGQFSPEDIAAIKRAGIERVVSLRTEGEVKWDEEQAILDAGLVFDSIPIGGPESLTEDVFLEACLLLKQNDGKLLLHCGSATRVGAIWMAHRVLQENVPLEQARAEARKIGLASRGHEQAAVDHIQKQLEMKQQLPQTEESVRPGINDSFKDPELDPEDFIKRFEIESREVYSARMEVLKACDIQPGSTIADVGAGTGIYTRLFANQTGPSGWVYAVDISPRLLEHTLAQAKQRDQRNVTGVLCQDDSANLPPNSVDLVFICDTYHHFEYPQSTLASIFSALKPGGRLVVIDFHRIEGKSRPWLMEHVRAGQEVFRSEIESAGFKLKSDLDLAGLEENYFMMFTK